MSALRWPLYSQKRRFPARADRNFMNGAVDPLWLGEAPAKL
jgi:hypothetical protein